MHTLGLIIYLTRQQYQLKCILWDWERTYHNTLTASVKCLVVNVINIVYNVEYTISKDARTHKIQYMYYVLYIRCHRHTAYQEIPDIICAENSPFTLRVLPGRYHSVCVSGIGSRQFCCWQVIRYS